MIKLPFKNSDDRNRNKREYYKKNKKRINAQRKEYNKVWREKNPNKVKEYSRQYREKNRDKIRNYYWKNRERIQKKYKEKFKQQKIRRAAIRQEIIILLGNKCANPYNLPHPDWCNDPKCLQIDHVHGGGYKEIKKHLSNYQKIILEKIKSGSKDYQLLCANCNWIKRRECEVCQK